VPDLALLDATAPTAPTFAEVATRWQASRVDVRENTRLQHRSALGRILPLIGTRRIDTITTADIAALVAHLAGQGKARATIQKSITATAMVLDFAGIKDNPARDHVVVRLPREEPHAMEPPRAEHVEAVGWVLTVPYTIALLALDATGARVGELEAATLGDLDESRSAWLVRASVAKTRQARWVTVPDDLYAVIIGRLPAREDRDAAAPLFADVTGDRLRTAIGRACRDAGVPRFSPHDLRHRRISLWHRQRVSWAEIGERVGQRNLMTTANTYTHALIDSREVDRALILAEHVSSARTVLSPVLPQDAK
jgi:integrase